MACVGYLYSNPLQTVLEGIETEVQSLQTVEVRRAKLTDCFGFRNPSRWGASPTRD